MARYLGRARVHGERVSFFDQQGLRTDAKELGEVIANLKRVGDENGLRRMRRYVEDLHRICCTDEEKEGRHHLATFHPGDDDKFTFRHDDDGLHVMRGKDHVATFHGTHEAEMDDDTGELCMYELSPNVSHFEPGGERETRAGTRTQDSSPRHGLGTITREQQHAALAAQNKRNREFWHKEKAR